MLYVLSVMYVMYHTTVCMFVMLCYNMVCFGMLCRLRLCMPCMLCIMCVIQVMCVMWNMYVLYVMYWVWLPFQYQWQMKDYSNPLLNMVTVNYWEGATPTLCILCFFLLCVLYIFCFFCMVCMLCMSFVVYVWFMQSHGMLGYLMPCNAVHFYVSYFCCI